jgi:nitrogen regulatory protein PII
VYLVEAVLRPERTADVIAALTKFGYKDDILISDVKGRRREVGGEVVREYRGHTFVMKVPKSKTKMELIIGDEQLEDIINIIRDTAKTGNYGDGKIFVYPVADIMPKPKALSKSSNKETGEKCKVNERDELLKKLGIKLPDDDFIENIINETFVPDKAELREMEKNATEKLSKNLFDMLKEQEIIDDYVLDVEVEYENGAYKYMCKICLIPKRSFGLIKKKINIDSIRKRTGDLLDSFGIDAKYDIQIKVF